MTEELYFESPWAARKGAHGSRWQSQSPTLSHKTRQGWNTPKNRMNQRPALDFAFLPFQEDQPPDVHKSQNSFPARNYDHSMPWGLKRFQQARCLHFVTFSGHHRDPLLAAPHARDVFEQNLERVRRWYGFFVSGHVVMPEHVHLLISEPERATLSTALRLLKQNTADQPVHPKAVVPATPLLRFQWVERGEANRNVTVHTSQSGKTRLGRVPRGLAVEQIPPLCLRCRRNSRNRIAVGGA
jgi:REP element-mobilizing transposase RayT